MIIHKFRKKYVITFSLLVSLFILAFSMRLSYILFNGYPQIFHDYAGHTLSILNTLENFNSLFYLDFIPIPNWYLSGESINDRVWWFQMNPPLSYILGDLLISPFVKDINVGWVSGALFYSLGIFTIYYFVNYFLKNKKTALIASLIYAINPADSFSIAVGAFMHGLAITIYPLLIIYTHKLLNNNNNKKNLLILTFLLWAIINSYIVYFGVYIIGLIIYYLINKFWYKKRFNFKQVILCIILSLGLSTIYLIRFFKLIFKQNLGYEPSPPITALFDINLLKTYFPHDSWGVEVYNHISLPLKILSIIFLIQLIYKIYKKNKAGNNLLFFFSGPTIFYLLQFIGLSSYPRRVLFQTPQLLSIAGVIGLMLLLKVKARRIIKNLMIMGAIIMILIIDITNIQSFIDNKPLIMNNQRYEAILWLRENIPENETIYFLNSDAFLGFNEWKCFTYKKHVVANENSSSKFFHDGTLYDELLNYNYIVVNNVGTQDVINYVNIYLEVYNYSIIYENEEVGVLAK